MAVGLFGVGEADARKFGQRTLKPGMRGSDVTVLQRNLTRLKLPTGADGHFGKRTRKNVRRLERRKSWRVDGRVQRKEAKRIKGMIAKQRARKRSTKRAAGAPLFPIPGAHNFGASQSRFGARRSGHSHQGQDVFAACGSRLLAAQGGRVKAKAYQASGAGYYMVIAGLDGRDYVYMHLRKASWARQGQSLYAGQQIGRVGDSGNASGCHLHFELWSAPGWYSGGKAFDPLPELLAWDAYS
jgi:murein DD-endopeptidase MepM/ murein hydrolase activator NlpD